MTRGIKDLSGAVVRTAQREAETITLTVERMDGSRAAIKAPYNAVEITPLKAGGMFDGFIKFISEGVEP